MKDLRRFAEAFVSEESEQSGRPAWWNAPLLAAAPSDSRFDALPKIAAADHFLPRDLLPTVKSVIVFFIPFKKALVMENATGDRPCRNWGAAYVQTNNLIERLSRGLADLLSESGFACALTPATHNFDEVRLMARWSHKHLAHLVNLGRFGTHHMMITPSGCAGRLGSLVSEMDLGDHPLIETDQACLSKAGHECGRCIQACPVAALQPKAFDRKRCWNRLKDNRHTLVCLADLPETTHVCGKCAASMPCSFINPVAEI